MLQNLSHTSIWVHDQDEALAFWTQKVGLEVRDDVTVPELGNFRWVTVGLARQPDVAIALMAVPGPPVFDADTAAQINNLVAKGAAGGLFFATDDCQATYEELRGRGVEFTEEPAKRPYGTEAVCRDNSGNWLVLVEPSAWTPEDFG